MDAKVRAVVAACEQDVRRGSAKLKKNDFRGAEGSFHKGIQRISTSGMTVMNFKPLMELCHRLMGLRSEALRRSGQHDSAIEDAKRCIRLFPNRGHGYMMLGQAIEASLAAAMDDGKGASDLTEEALAAYKTAQLLDPKCASTAIARITKLQMRTKPMTGTETVDAIRTWKAQVGDSSQPLNVRKMAAISLYGVYFKGYPPVKPDWELARRYIREAANMGDVSAWHHYGLMLVDAGDAEADDGPLADAQHVGVAHADADRHGMTRNDERMLEHEYEVSGLCAMGLFFVLKAAKAGYVMSAMLLADKAPLFATKIKWWREAVAMAAEPEV